MATNAQLTAQIYIAFYNRAPDPVGQEYWIGRLNAGVPLADIANSFAASPEAQATYPYFLAPNLLPPDQFLNQVYLNVFGRPIDPAGLGFYSNKLANGVSPGEVLLEIIQNAVTNTTPGNTDAQFLANKVAVGLDWSATAAESHAIPGISLYNPDGSLTAAASASAHGVIEGVTANPATVIEGMEETAAFFVPTFTLTTGVDIFDGTAGGTDGNDIFNAPLAVGIDGLVGVQTLQGADVLNGGGGENNVLNAELNGTGTTANPTLSNIQTLNLTSVFGLAGGLGGPGALDLSRATGVEEIWNVNSRNALDVWGVQAPVVIGLDGVLGDDAGPIGTETYIGYDFDTRIDEQTVIANRVGSEDSGRAHLEIDAFGGIETLNLEVSNNVYLRLEDEADEITNLNIIGSGLLDLQGDSDFENLVALNAVDLDGDLTVDVSGGDILESALTGDGNDFVIVSNDAMNGDLTVDLGDGENTLGIEDNDGGTLDHNEINALNFLGGVFGVQTLAFTDDISLNNDATLDLTGFDVPPATILFEDFDTNNDDFTIENAGADLLLSASEDFDMNGGDLIVNGVVNLTVESTGDDVFLDGNVVGDVLKSLTVTADDDATVTLGSTNVTTVTVTAGAHADIDIGDGLFGSAAFLTTLTVTANTANIDLGDGPVSDDFSSFTTLDLQNIVTDVVVNTEDANFDGPVTYLIGATQDGGPGIDVDFASTRSDTRETFDFVGSDIGHIWIDDFVAGGGGNSDRLDLSQFGITGAAELNIVNSGGNLVITDVGGDDFSGSITLQGLAGDGNDVALFNIIYA